MPPEEDRFWTGGRGDDDAGFVLLNRFMMPPPFPSFGKSTKLPTPTPSVWIRYGGWIDCAYLLNKPTAPSCTTAAEPTQPIDKEPVRETLLPPLLTCAEIKVQQPPAR